VRTLLHAAGLRYRVDLPLRVGRVLVRPDIAFTKVGLAVFIDGCFWHCCPEHGSLPATNTSYWTPKLDATVARDAAHSRLLEGSGWTVLRFWEHESASDVAAIIGRSVAALHGDSDRRRL
jgi:DNA mismatch endonuclease, patch repair protein